MIPIPVWVTMASLSEAPPFSRERNSRSAMPQKFSNIQDWIYKFSHNCKPRFLCSFWFHPDAYLMLPLRWSLHPRSQLAVYICLFVHHVFIMYWMVWYLSLCWHLHCLSLELSLLILDILFIVGQRHYTFVTCKEPEIFLPLCLVDISCQH